MAKEDFEIRYDRVVTDEFLRHFLPGGVAASLAPMARDAAFPLDLQFRKNAKTGRQWATVYAGLTAVLNVEERSRGFRLSAHDTWSKMPKYGFDQRWRSDLAKDELASVWTAVELYLERVIPAATKSHGVTEGAVQAAVSKSRDKSWVMLDREVVTSFRDQATKEKTLTRCYEPIVAALPSDIPGVTPKKFGPECDLLALRPETGQLVAVEVKPYDGAGIAWVAAQATMYARLLNEWITADDRAEDIVRRTVRQRQQLGLFDAPFKVDLSLPVAPVVALQRGAGQKQKERMIAVRNALPYADLGVPTVEILEVSITGDLTPLA